MSRNEGVSVLTLPFSSCVRSLSLLRRRAVLRIYCTHCWKLHPSSAQPPIHLKPLGPHHGDTVAPEHSAWCKLLAAKWGMAPTGAEEGEKCPSGHAGSPKKHLVCEESRGTHSIVPHSPATFSWCLGSLFSQGLQQFHALYMCPC